MRLQVQIHLSFVGFYRYEPVEAESVEEDEDLLRYQLLMEHMHA